MRGCVIRLPWTITFSSFWFISFNWEWHTLCFCTVTHHSISEWIDISGWELSFTRIPHPPYRPFLPSALTILIHYITLQLWGIEWCFSGEAVQLKRRFTLSISWLALWAPNTQGITAIQSKVRCIFSPHLKPFLPSWQQAVLVLLRLIVEHKC